MTKQEVLAIAKPIILTDKHIHLINSGYNHSFYELADFNPTEGKDLPSICQKDFVYDAERNSITCRCCGFTFNNVNANFKVGDIVYVKERTAKNSDGSYKYKADNLSDTTTTWLAASRMAKAAVRIALVITHVSCSSIRAIPKTSLQLYGFTDADWYAKKTIYHYEFKTYSI